MTTAAQMIRNTIDTACLSTRCANEGCSLSLTGITKPYVLLDLEHPKAPVPRNQAHCDFLFVGMPDIEGKEWVVPIELTRGSSKTGSDFVAQLSGGATVADRLLGRDKRVKFRPIAAHNGGISRRVVDELKKARNRIRFRGNRIVVKLVRCGSELGAAL